MRDDEDVNGFAYKLMTTPAPLRPDDVAFRTELMRRLAARGGIHSAADMAPVTALGRQRRLEALAAKFPRLTPAQLQPALDRAAALLAEASRIMKRGGDDRPEGVRALCERCPGFPAAAYVEAINRAAHDHW